MLHYHTLLIDNLDNTNNIYWKNLRLQVEKWQLQFLSQHTNRSSSLLQLVGLTNFATIDKLTKKEWNKGIEKGKNRMIININEIKYRKYINLFLKMYNYHFLVLGF